LFDSNELPVRPIWSKAKNSILGPNIAMPLAQDVSEERIGKEATTNTGF
jgi:hypothetical protein